MTEQISVAATLTAVSGNAWVGDIYIRPVPYAKNIYPV